MPKLRFEYTVPCPRCDAEKGQPCHSSRGNWMNPHAQRSDLVFEAWRLGYADGVEMWAHLMERLEIGSANLLSDVDFVRQSVAERVFDA